MHHVKVSTFGGCAADFCGAGDDEGGAVGRILESARREGRARREEAGNGREPCGSGELGGRGGAGRVGRLAGTASAGDLQRDRGCGLLPGSGTACAVGRGIGSAAPAGGAAPVGTDASAGQRDAVGAAGEPASQAPGCATCGRVLRPSGERRRQVVTRMGGATTLTRRYWVCPGCGAGQFPPG